MKSNQATPSAGSVAVGVPVACAGTGHNEVNDRIEGQHTAEACDRQSQKQGQHARLRWGMQLGRVYKDLMS